MMTTTHDVGQRRSWAGIIALDALEYVESMYEKFDYVTTFMATGYEGTVSSASRDGRGTDIKEVKRLMTNLKETVGGLGFSVSLCKWFRVRTVIMF